MRHNYSLFLITLFIGINYNLIGQVTLNQSNAAPVPGDRYNMHYTGYQTPGNGGTGAAWDFSNMTIDSSFALNFIAPSQTPYAHLFPNATAAIVQNGNYDFYSTNSSVYSRLGIINSTADIIYSDSHDILRFPFSMGTSFNDIYTSTFTAGGNTYYRTATVAVSGDGLGTLKLPFGTENDVLRIKYIEEIKDSIDFGGFPLIIDTYMETYLWFKEGIHHPILGFSDIYSMGQTIQTGYYMDLTTVGLKDLALTNSNVTIYPNPTSGNASLEFELGVIENVQISIVNMMGSIIHRADYGNLNAGKHNLKLDLNRYPVGIYLINLKIGDTLITQKIQKL